MSDLAIPATFSNLPLRVVNGDELEGSMPDQRVIIRGSASETFLSAARRVQFDATRSQYWTMLISGELDAPFWLLRDEYLRPDLALGSCSVDVDATLGDLVAYFGPGLEDGDFRIAVVPAEPIGGGFGSEWIELAREGADVLASMSPIEIVRHGFEGLGWIGAVRHVPRAVAKARARRVRLHAAKWLHTDVVSRRLVRYLRRKRNWETADLSQRLEIDHRSAGVLLHLAGFDLSVKDYRTWTRRSS